jgi:hypothetical protein
MTQAKLRFYDTDEKKEVGSTPLDKVPMIPRVGEVVILPEGSNNPAEYKVTEVNYEYRLSSATDVETASVILAVKRRKPPAYGLTTYLAELAKGR